MLIPSGISALRLAALPLFLYFFFNGNTALAMVVFSIAAVTDLFDGYIARKLGAGIEIWCLLRCSSRFYFCLWVFFAAFTLNSYYHHMVACADCGFVCAVSIQQSLHQETI